MPLVGLLRRGTSFFTNSPPPPPSTTPPDGQTTRETLFPLVVCEHDDGGGGDQKKKKKTAAAADCDHDCAACPSAGDGASGYGRAFDKIGIDADSELFGGVKQYSRHAIVATGECDWIRDVEEVAGSVMEALKGAAEKGLVDDRDGRLMISASNMNPPALPALSAALSPAPPAVSPPTAVLLLPSWVLVEGVTPETTPELISRFINPSPTTLDPPPASPAPSLAAAAAAAASTTSLLLPAGRASRLTLQIPASPSPVLPGSPTSLSPTKPGTPLTPTPDLQTLSLHDLPYTLDSTLRATPFPHDALILLCSHKRRDARCGLSAPLLRGEFERHLRPLGLWRDLADTRAGGVKVLFVSHVGGHRWAANVIVYRRRGDQAVQGVWLAKIAIRHVEGIVKHTVLEGRVCDSGLLRAGFDRAAGVNSW